METLLRPLARIFGVLFIFWTAGCGPSGSQSGPSVTENGEGTAVVYPADTYAKAIELKNRGIGHIENKEWQDAERALSSLSELLPDNRLSLKNLAISRALALLDSESPYSRVDAPADYAKAMDLAMQTVQKLEAKFPQDAALAGLMRGKLLAHQDSPDKSTIHDAISVLQAAAAASGNQPDYWFAVVVAMDGHRDYGDSAVLLETLLKCFDLAPQNLFVLQKLMERQALALSSQDEQVRELAAKLPQTLKSARELLLPMVPAIVRQRRVDPVALIDQAMAAYDGSNPMVLMGPTMVSKNVLLPELATQIDRRRIDRILLEYLVPDFDSGFLNQARNAGVLPRPSATVLKGFSEAEILPDVPKITDLQFCDFDLDGAEDLIVAAEGRIRIYSRGAAANGDWKLLAETPSDAGPFVRFLMVDIDRDFDRVLSDIRSPVMLRDRDGDRRMPTDASGKNRWFDTDLDLIAWGDGAVQIFRNDLGEDRKRNLTPLPQDASPNAAFQVVAADLEADGDLDLIAATPQGLTVLRNIDGSRFDVVTEGLALPDHPVNGLAIGDWNRDMAMDVVGVSTAGKTGVLQNMLHNRFRWLTDGEELQQVPNASIVRIGDFDGNLSWDLLTAGPEGIHLQLTQMSVTGVMSTLSTAEVSSAPVSFMQLADMDNDGAVDIVASGESGLLLFRGTSDGRFEQFDVIDAAEASGFAERSICCADYDDDGDLDILLASADGAGITVLLNDGGNSNGWLQVVARAVGDDPQNESNRVNMHAIGSVIELKAGGAYQAHIIDRPVVHLGLGKSSTADVVRVIWTDGVPQNVLARDLLKARAGILAPQILKGSCPYIYTWNGEKFEFFSDCLWAAPIGLVQASGDLAPTREWEYLLIPGEQLRPRDEHYVIQLTEELWEAAYFDHVQLVAVDHPDSVSIFTNEKVGSPAMAAHRIHTVRNRHLPKQVVDGTGRDLLPALSAQDGDYVQPFQRRLMQGLTEPWLMEFDPGLKEKPKNLRLVLIGWVFPTDTSLNVAISQNPQLEPPQPPRLEVRDGEGNWVLASPFIGFPSGKTKAMVVDISDIFITDDFRFRLSSSMELYWDAAFFIVDEQDAETLVYDCPLVDADLHYRGFSRRTYADNALFRNGHAPESYDYDSVTREPRWPAMMGRFTRYGDATPLIRAEDDQLVVMGPGDELTLRFTVPKEVPEPGWKRDFVLYNVGWDKDADLNTVYGQSSEPWPFKAMTQYPLPPDQSEPTSVEYLQYIERWQTREYGKRSFWGIPSAESDDPPRRQ